MAGYVQRWKSADTDVFLSECDCVWLLPQRKQVQCKGDHLKITTKLGGNVHCSCKAWRHIEFTSSGKSFNTLLLKDGLSHNTKGFLFQNVWDIEFRMLPSYAPWFTCFTVIFAVRPFFQCRYFWPVTSSFICVGTFITGFELNDVTKSDQRLFCTINFTGMGWTFWFLKNGTP